MCVSCCSNMSKIAQAEYRAKARFQALLRRRRFSRQRKEHRDFCFAVQSYDIKNPDAIAKITSGKQSGKKERIREEKREKLLFSLPIKT